MFSSASGVCQELPAYAHLKCVKEISFFYSLRWGPLTQSAFSVGPIIPEVFPRLEGSSPARPCLLLHSCLYSSTSASLAPGTSASHFPGFSWHPKLPFPRLPSCLLVFFSAALIACLPNIQLRLNSQNWNDIRRSYL